MRYLIAAACLALGVVVVAENATTAAAQKDGQPKYTISEVMIKAHKGKDALLTKVKGGKATDAEAKDLLVMYEALAQNKAPKGDPKDWKDKTDALVVAAKLVVDGKKDDGVAKLNTASNCMACHKAHKG